MVLLCRKINLHSSTNSKEILINHSTVVFFSLGKYFFKIILSLLYKHALEGLNLENSFYDILINYSG